MNTGSSRRPQNQIQKARRVAAVLALWSAVVAVATLPGRVAVAQESDPNGVATNSGGAQWFPDNTNARDDPSELSPQERARFARAEAERLAVQDYVSGRNIAKQVYVRRTAG